MTTRIVIEVTDQFLRSECEQYGPLAMCDLITEEQGIGIITDAVLMAMHLKLKK